MAGKISPEFKEEICKRNLGYHLEVILGLFKCVTTTSDPDKCMRSVKDTVTGL